MSVRSALTVVGTVVGAYFGYPQLGALLGSLVGSAVDPQIIPGPKIGEVTTQTAQEGGPRPIVFGTSQPLSPNVIAQGAPRIVKRQESQGKGGPKVETETLYRTYAVGICEGPIAGVLRVWRNNTLVYDTTEEALVGDDENQAFLDIARFYYGDYEQLPSPDLEALYGVGTTPAHRGTAYMVMVAEDLTDMRGAIPQWVFLVSGDTGSMRWIYDVPGTYTWNKPANLSHAIVRVLGAGGGGAAGRGSPSDDPRTGSGGGGGYASCRIATGLMGSTVSVVVGGGGIGGAGVLANTGGTIGSPGTAGGLSSFGSFAIGPGGEGGADPADSNPFSGEGGDTSDPDEIFPTPGVTDTVRESGGDSDADSAPQDSIFAGAHGAFGENQFGGALYGTSINLCDTGEEGVGGGGGEAAINADAGGAGDSVVAGCGGGSGGLCTILDGAYNDLIRSGGGGNGGPGLVIVDGIADGIGPGTVAAAITAICERAGVPSSMIDVTDLQDTLLDGFTITNSYMAIDALRSLGQVFIFDVVPVDGKILFPVRGKNSLLTVPADEYVDEGDDTGEDNTMRDDAIVVPRVLNLIYFDPIGGVAPSKQTSERAGDRRSIGDRTVQLAVNMDADYAAQLVTITHKVIAEDQRGTVRIVLSDKYIGLVPTDIIIAPIADVNHRLRIQRADLNNGYQVYECVRDRQSAYTSNVEGIPAVPPTAPPSSLVGETLLAALDISFITDIDDAVGSGYYVAISGVADAWAGATVEVSYDGGANYVDSASSTISAIMGLTTTVLNDHPAEYPDEESTCDIEISYSYSELESTDYEGVLNRQNLAAIGNEDDGYELVNFQDAEEVTPGVWRIGNFLRGRKNTETREHAIGEKFVLLDRSTLALIPEPRSSIGDTLTLRATSSGETVASGTVVSFDFQANIQREWAVADLEAELVGINAEVSWTGVGRYGGGPSSHGQWFEGYRVVFDDGGTPITVDTAATTLTHDVSTLTSPISVKVYQLNSITGAGPASEVFI